MKRRRYNPITIVNPKTIKKRSYIALAGIIAGIGLASYLTFSPLEEKASASKPGYIIYDNDFMKDEDSSKLENVVKNSDALIKTIHESSFERVARQNREKHLKVLYGDFPRPEEILKIVEHAEMVGVEPELLMAIRVAENGRDHIAYGVIPTKKYNEDKGYMKNGIFYPYRDAKEKQLRWAACTVKNNLNRFAKNPKNKDFISYLAKRYCPIGKNDHGHNKDWEPNVKKYYKKFKRNYSNRNL